MMLRKLLFSAFLTGISLSSYADNMRRTISTESPLWLFHVDVWSNANPQAIIDLIPDDIKPFVAFNLSVSGNKDRTHNGLSVLESWLTICAQNRVWATCQVASGGYSHLSDTDFSEAERFFEEYPNFLGFNYAEQFWGFNADTGIGDGTSPSVAHRYNVTFARLLEIAANNGGYLFVSNCKEETDYNAGTSPLQVIKDYTTFASAAREYADNLVYMEKHTSGLGFYGMESQTLGMWLSGYCGHYGMRWDECGYEAKGGTNRQAHTPEALGGAIMAEHMMFTGQTVQDGPELTWRQCVATLSDITTADGFKQHRWGLQPAMENVYMDLMRKWIAEGAYRIMSKQEVIDSTRIVVVNNLSTSRAEGRRTADNLFDMYQMDGGIHEADSVFTKKTGRYPCIPTVADIDEGVFDVTLLQSNYSSLWPTTAAKKEYLDRMFPKQAEGDLYVRSLDNVWMMYNPYTEKKSSARGVFTPNIII